MANKIYIHDGIEVRLTGRVAQRELRRGKIDEVVEVKPIGIYTDKFSKWVRQKDLFVVTTDVALKDIPIKKEEKDGH